jgi:hypothetical protein
LLPPVEHFAKVAATTILGAAPAGPVDELRLIRESNALRQSGQNYKVNGIEYDYKTGRALNPPTNVFIPVRQDDRIDPCLPTGSGRTILPRKATTHCPANSSGS